MSHGARHTVTQKHHFARFLLYFAENVNEFPNIFVTLHPKNWLDIASEDLATGILIELV